MELKYIYQFLSIEIAFIFFLTTVFLFFKVRKLKKAGVKVVKVKEKAPKKDDEESVSYLTFLNQAILATEIRMEEQAGGEELDDFDLGSELDGPLSLRRAFLEVEVNSIEESGEDGDAYWDCQEKNLKGIIEKISSKYGGGATIEEANTSSEEISGDAANSAEVDDTVQEELVQQIKEVKEELHVQKKINEDMQPFKRLLYDLAGQVKDVMEAEEVISENIATIKGKLGDGSESEMLDKVSEEHVKLSEVLSHIGEDEEDIDENIVNSIQAVLRMRSKRPKEKVVYVDQAEHKLRKEVENLKSKTKHQQETIDELQSALEGGDGASEEVASKMQSLQAAASEAEMCITVLEEENQHRQEQLEDLLMTIDGLTEKAERAEELEKEIERLTDTLASGGDVAESSESEASGSGEKVSNDSLDDGWMEELQEANQELSKEIAAMREEKNQIIAELEEKTAEAEKLSSTIKRFSSETGDVMNSVATLEDMNDSLMEEIDQLKAEKEAAQTKVNELEVQLKDLSSGEIVSSEVGEDQVSGNISTEKNADEEKEMSDDDIEALLNSASPGAGESQSNAETEAGSAEETEKEMSEDDIESLLDAASGSVSQAEEQSENNEAEELQKVMNEKVVELEKSLDEVKEEKVGLENSFKEVEQRLEESKKELETKTEQLSEKEAVYERLKKEFIEMETNLLMRM